MSGFIEKKKDGFFHKDIFKDHESTYLKSYQKSMNQLI